MGHSRLKEFATVALGLAAIVGFAGCGDVNVTETNPTGATGATVQAAKTYPAHGPETRDLLQDPPRPWLPGSIEIDPAWEADLTAFAKAGPVHVIIANMSALLERLRDAGFNGRDTALHFCFSRSYAGANWDPRGDSEALVLKTQEGQLADFWRNYVDALIRIMSKSPDMTAKIVINDGPDVLGLTVGSLTERAFPDSLRSRVSLGDALPECGPGTNIVCH